MRVHFTSHGDFANSRSFLKKGSDKSKYHEILTKAGEMGVGLLQAGTPKRSGITASGWNYKIEGKKDSEELIFYNNAHPELSVNLAMLIQLGHGTRNGGYVPPVNYIHPAMEPVYKMVGEELSRSFDL